MQQVSPKSESVHNHGNGLGEGDVEIHGRGRQFEKKMANVINSTPKKSL